MWTRRSRRMVMVLALLLLMMLVSPLAQAAESFAGLNAAIRAANSGAGGVIALSADITLSGPLPPITGEVTIEGAGHSINGAEAFRIFDVNGGRLRLKHITLTEGKAGHGGAIRLRNGARVVVEESTLSANSATNGGAIATSSSADKLSVGGSRFLSNKADKNAAAIYANGGTIDISDSVFEKNCGEIAIQYVDEDSAIARQEREVDNEGCLRVTYHWTNDYDHASLEGDGGAIRLLAGARVEISASSFSKNKGIHGGAIAVTDDSAELSVRGSSFMGNYAERFGGAIYVGSGKAAITQSSFLDNYSDASGGAIFGQSGDISIANSTFHNNRASAWGGAMTVRGGTATLTHLTMMDNWSTHGKGHAITKEGGSVRLRNSLVANQGKTDDCAGGLDEMAGNLSVDGTCALLPSDDLLLGPLSGEPAWFPLMDFSPAVDRADPEYCLDVDQIGTARRQGGGCDIGAIESMTALPEPTPVVPPPPCPLALQIIAANTDAPAGGCPAGDGHDVITFTQDITLDAALPHISSDITIEGKGYTISGGGLFRIFSVDSGKLTINDLTLTAGNATSGINESGGAIRLGGTAQVIVNNSIFRDNLATDGGAIGVAAGTPTLSINGSRFVGNRADFGGGAIQSNGKGRIKIAGSSFVRNATSITGWGGAINGLNANTIDISNSTFYGNIANSGGAISARWTSVTLTHVTMVDNAAFGTGIYLEKDARGAVRLRNSLIVGRGNVAHCYGRLTQNVGNYIADGSCSPKLSGDPLIAEAAEDSLPNYLDLLPGSPAIDAADPAYCSETDQIGRERPRNGFCDIGAIEAFPKAEQLSDCAVTTTHGLNFREGPGGERLGTVPERETLLASARTPGWFEVEYEGAAGWISADYVVTEGECA